MNDMEQRKAAKEFVSLWKGRGDEKQETQQFWSDLLHRVYGITDFSQRVKFEKKVPLLHTSFIDVYIPETKVIIEQKSQDIDLLKRKKQSDGTELNPYEQAHRYGGKLPYSERPRWIVTCNFQKFLIYDMDDVRPEEKPVEILLEDLPEKYHLLSFLVDPGVKKITVEQQLSVKAGELVGKLYDLMLPQYKDPTAESTLQSLNKFCVRVVFCLYAEDALLFGNKGSEFHDYLASFLPDNRRTALIKLFRILDQKEEERDPYEEQKLLDFPYVNGGLFAGDIEIPQLTEEITQLILEDMSENLDWSKISPTIFGAVFESTLNPETRRKGGMHYTSIENIHKVIDPLFLDDLQTEFDNILHDPKLSKPKRAAALEAFHERLAKLHFLDPACGSGNFLTETFLSIRRLENKVIEHLQRGLMVLEFANPVKVSIGQFGGIEINDFAVTVARTALWIAESQMIKETEAIVNQTIEFFPLKTDAKIVEGNALRMDWNEVISKYACTYIMGNPPFVGMTQRNDEQKNDMENIFPDNDRAGRLDYVTAWYKKASQFIQWTTINVAFVSTNSIVQGEQVPILWQDLFINENIKINFAWRSFEWSNEATEQAHVYCVIIGFSCNRKYDNYIYEEVLTNDQQKDFLKTQASHINGYLINYEDIYIKLRTKKAPYNFPMIQGNKPWDGKALLLLDSERIELIKKHPSLNNYIKRYTGSQDFIKNKIRYCLWFKDEFPQEFAKIPEIEKRLLLCAEVRRKTKTVAVHELANYPWLFTQIRQPDTEYLAVPEVSGESRRYIPLGYLSKEVIASNKIFMIPNAPLWLFGIMTSNVHMAWMRTVAGRLGTSYSYSPSVYNNFPWINLTDLQKQKIEKTAKNILDVRAKYPNKSLKELYDKDMFYYPDLKKAHQANDRAVMEVYGMWKKVESESECVAWLFRMYQELAKK